MTAFTDLDGEDFYESKEKYGKSTSAQPLERKLRKNNRPLSLTILDEIKTAVKAVIDSD